jgi:tripartite-type tricarboxylate transporter receptor subunit TctC
MKKLLGIDIVHIPYKGAGPAVTDLLGGQIQMMMVTPLLVEPHARSGKLKLIAAATPKRIAKLPDLPTVAESGVPGYEAGTWFALAGPAGMPREVTYAIYNEVKKVLNEPAFRDKYIDRQWFEVVANNPDDFAEFLKADYERWEKLIRLSGVKVD